MTASGEFRELHYPADVTGTCIPDSPLGTDILGRPYKVLQAWFDGERSTVVLTYASPDDVQRWMDLAGERFRPAPRDYDAYPLDEDWQPAETVPVRDGLL